MKVLQRENVSTVLRILRSVFVKSLAGVQKKRPNQCRREIFHSVNSMFICLQRFESKHWTCEEFHCLYQNIGRISVIRYNCVRWNFQWDVFLRRNVRKDTIFPCAYDKDNDTFRPIFRIGTILDDMNLNSTRQAALFKNVNSTD